MQNTVRIAHVFPSFSFGGQQARFAALATGLGRGFSHTIISLDGDLAARALISDAADVEYQTFQHHKSSLASLSNVLGLRSILTETKSDILCTYNWGSIEAVIANRFGATFPHVHFEDGFGPGESAATQPKRRILARRLLLRNAVTIVPSRVLEDVAVNQWKLPKQKIRRMTNGVDFEKFQVTLGGIRPEIKIGSVGALRAEKNYERLIRSFVRADPGKRSTLTIVGDGPERRNLKSVISELNAGDRVFLPGATDKPEEAYAHFDIFALSSDTEQAPISLIEAMAAGLPVISTNVGDIVDMVCENNRAFVTPHNDDESYVEAMIQLLQNANARAKIGAENRQKARESFSIDAMIDAYRQLFLEITSS